MARHEARLRSEEERIALLCTRLEEDLPERARPQDVAAALAHCGGRPGVPHVAGDADVAVTFRAAAPSALAGVVARLSAGPAALLVVDRLQRKRLRRDCAPVRPPSPEPCETAASWLPPRPPSWHLLAARRGGRSGCGPARGGGSSIRTPVWLPAASRAWTRVGNGRPYPAAIGTG